MLALLPRCPVPFRPCHRVGSPLPLSAQVSLRSSTSPPAAPDETRKTLALSRLLFLAPSHGWGLRLTVLPLEWNDPAMKQFLLYLDESNALGKKFIIQDIDDTHVFVIAELVNVLQERISNIFRFLGAGPSVCGLEGGALPAGG
ncbi:General transcription factor IIH subunit 5 [Galemys pyrenaicus]|uniref:General transcription and DNA repair factor IIH subunit TFB5 n=1 Tax=Galemys pyrenaicus TaxID=202257 RepID=A0A8J6DY88_GALPY|nr:General transcription factor IIH subunit 5 [Galemys pyrenaicus]